MPLFVTQSWFTRLLRILVSDPLTLPSNIKTLYFSYRRKTIPEMPDVKLLNYHVSGNHSKIKAYQKTFQRYSPVVERWHQVELWLENHFMEDILWWMENRLYAAVCYWGPEISPFIKIKRFQLQHYKFS